MICALSVSVYVCKQRQPVVSSCSAGYKSYKCLVLEDDKFIQLLEWLALLKNAALMCQIVMKDSPTAIVVKIPLRDIRFLGQIRHRNCAPDN